METDPPARHGRGKLAAALRLAECAFLALLLTLGSTFVGERWSTAIYADIMGCEAGCRVAATGWPLIFVRDYTGMSVVNTADILEVWFAADRFDRLPFAANLLFWTGLVLLLWSAARKLRRGRAGQARTGRA